MKPFIHLTLCFICFWGCGPSTPALPTLLPPNFFIPTLAAAAALTTTKSANPNTPVTPVTPVGPSTSCENCGGDGELGDLTVIRPCPVCGGDGILDSTASPSDLTPSLSGASDQQPAGHPTTDGDVDPNPPPADTYTSINYVSLSEAQKQSLETGKPIWIHITNLKTCRECIRLEREVLPDKELIKLSRNFICVRLLPGDQYEAALRDGSGTPLDVFGSASSWKNLRRYYCPKTVSAYIKQLKTQGNLK